MFLKRRAIRGIIVFLVSIMFFSLSSMTALAYNCRNATIIKTITSVTKAEPEWSIAKKADKSNIELQKGGSDKVTYEISLDRTEVQSWIIKGQISIENESGQELTVDRIRDWLYTEDDRHGGLVRGEYDLTLTGDSLSSPVMLNYKVTDRKIWHNYNKLWQDFSFDIPEDETVIFDYTLVFSEFSHVKHGRPDSFRIAEHNTFEIDMQETVRWPDDDPSVPKAKIPNGQITLQETEIVNPNKGGVTFQVDEVKIDGVQTANINGPWTFKKDSKITIEKTVTGHVAGAYTLINTAKLDNDKQAQTAIIITVRAPNLTIKKTIDKPQIYPGDTITYTLTVKNTGDGIAKNVVISDTLKSGFSYVTGSGNPLPASTSPLTWNIGNMAAGDVQTISYKVKAADDIAPGFYDNNAQVSCTNCVAISTQKQVQVLQKPTPPSGGGEETPTFVKPLTLPKAGSPIDLLSIIYLSLIISGVGIAMHKKV